MLIILAIFLSICKPNKAQLLATSNQTSILIFPQLQIKPYLDTSTKNKQNIQVISFAQNNDYIYVLSTNNAIQVHQKSNPSIIVSSMLQFNKPPYSSNLTLQSLLINDVGDVLIAVGIQNSSTLGYYFFQAGSTLQFLYNQQIIQITKVPLTSYFANSQICSFFSVQFVNDRITCLDYQQNYTYTIILASVNSSISISPDSKYAIIWTRHTEVYIYQLYYNFTQYLFYGDSQTNQKDATETIRFSTDSRRFILQADNHHQIKIIDVETLQITTNITNKGKVISVNYVDVENRFVLIVKSNETSIYDMDIGEKIKMNDTLKCERAIQKQNDSRIWIGSGKEWNIYGINVTKECIIQQREHIYSSSNSSTIFFYELNLSLLQNHTFQTFSSVSIFMIDIAQTFNIIVFSSPLASFFLSFFNYFTLNSLYILLDLPLPKIIFDQFSALYFALNQNLLVFFGIDFTVGLNSAQLIDQQKPLYFGITSDLIKNSYYQIAIFLVSFLIIELLYLFRSRNLQNCIIKSVKIERSQLYYGLIISNILGIVLPVKYFFRRTFPNIITKINMGVSCMLIIVILHYILSQLISAFELEKKAKAKSSKIISKAFINFLWEKQSSTKQKHKRYEKIPDWFIAWQNFIYGLLVLLQNEKYFLTIIFVSKTVQLIINIRYSNESKCIYILKCSSLVCELIFHTTFVIFSCSQSNDILIYNSIICLGVFWIGGLLNFIQVIIFIVKVIVQSFIKIKQLVFPPSKVSDLTEIKKKKRVKFDIGKTDGSSSIKGSQTEFVRKDARKQQIIFKKKEQFFKGRSVFFKKIKITFVQH